SGVVEPLLGSHLVVALGARVARRMEAVREKAQEARPRAVEAEILRVRFAGFVVEAPPYVVCVRALDLDLPRIVRSKDQTDEGSILFDEAQRQVTDLARANCPYGAHARYLYL